jgi:hypothetical protein
VSTPGDSSSSIVVFPQSANGSVSPTITIPGSLVSTDAAGNLYVFTGNSIDEYPAGLPTDKPLRSLPVGPTTKISALKDVIASPSGEIFVSDGKGIAVFGSSASGDVDPDRYIMGISQTTDDGASTMIAPGLLTLGPSDTLYVQNPADSSIMVFGNKDTGNVVPSRTIAGPLTRLTGAGYHFILGMATDTPGNLYVLCLCASIEGPGVDYGVFEFDPAANGNVAPIRFVTTPKMYPYTSDGNAIAVDSNGTLYISTGTSSEGMRIFEFPATASGSVAPSNTVIVSGWTDSPPSRIAVH